MKTPIDQVAEFLGINPDNYDASDCEQALYIAIEQDDITVKQLIIAIGNIKTEQVLGEFLKELAPALEQQEMKMRKALAPLAKLLWRNAK